MSILLCADTFASHIEFDIATFLIGVITLGIGFYKINEYRQESKFGFQINISFFIDRLKSLITDPKEKTMPLMSAWYFLSEITKQQGEEEYGKVLQNLSSEFLHYLSNASKQVPPSNCNKNEWRKKMKTLGKYLIYFSLSSLPLPEKKPDMEVKQLHRELVETLDWIDEKIQGYHHIK
jgi:hypothetical protein